MKRDWDVIREVLTEVESLDEGRLSSFQYSSDDQSDACQASKAAHAILLWKAGYLEGIDAGGCDGACLMSPELSWAGHDLLGTLRSKDLWERVKSTASAKGIELTFDAVKALAQAALTSMTSSGP